jgi:3-phosphoshikimate 1-carboxyvinyltransferase
VNVRILSDPAPLRGTVQLPGDKSISHRVVLFAAMAAGSSRLTGVLDSADVCSTVEAVRALGARVAVETRSGGLQDLVIEGWGAEGPRPPAGPIDCGNSGTTVRLLMGVLARAGMTVMLVGDESLSSRPMRRVADPLGLMGATVDLAGSGTLPAAVTGGVLRAIRYEMPVASAQVKSAILLAGLGAAGRTTVIEPAPSRDHTERLLPAFGAGVGRSHDENACWVDGPAELIASDVPVARDPSSAAFMAVLGILVPDSQVVMPGVALNGTRTGFVRVLDAMGAEILVEPTGACGAEPVGTLTAAYTATLKATCVPSHEAPSLIDEVPVLAVAATQAHGVTRFEGVGELRVKESDRLSAVEQGLRALGATVRSGLDWLEVEGPCRLAGADLDSLGDHRLAMAWTVAGTIAAGPVSIATWEATEVSYPRFAADLEALSGGAVVMFPDGEGPAS